MQKAVKPSQGRDWPRAEGLMLGSLGGAGSIGPHVATGCGGVCVCVGGCKRVRSLACGGAMATPDVAACCAAGAGALLKGLRLNGRRWRSGAGLHSHARNAAKHARMHACAHRDLEGNWRGRVGNSKAARNMQLHSASSTAYGKFQHIACQRATPRLLQPATAVHSRRAVGHPARRGSWCFKWFMGARAGGCTHLGCAGGSPNSLRSLAAIFPCLQATQAHSMCVRGSSAVLPRGDLPAAAILCQPLSLCGSFAF